MRIGDSDYWAVHFWHTLICPNSETSATAGWATMPSVPGIALPCGQVMPLATQLKINDADLQRY